MICGRRFLLSATVLGLVACGPESPLVAPVESAEAQKIRAEAIATHRDFITGIFGEGQALVDTCKPGVPDAVRLTFHDPAFERAFTLGFTAEAKGAVAMWQALREDATTHRVQTVGVQGVRMDGNGWRQVQQLLRDPRFVALPPQKVEPTGGRYRPEGDTYRIESCFDGQYRLTVRNKPDAEVDRALFRAAQGMQRLAGGVY
jgi:hypothetical protein